MDWDILSDLITLIGLIGTFVGVTGKITKALTEFSLTAKHLAEKIETQGGEHIAMRKDINKNSERIADHETRLQIIEHDKEN